MHDSPTAHEKFLALLPFFTNGGLEEEDRQWMVRYIDQHPETQPLTVFEQRLRQSIQDTQSLVPEATRLKALLNAYRELHGKPSLSTRLRRWFTGTYSIPAPLILASIAIVMIQGAYIAVQAPADLEQERYRAIESPCFKETTLRIRFNPDASQADIVLLLRGVEGSIVAGPTETGQIWVAIPHGKSPEEAANQLRASPSVEEVERIPPTCGDRQK